MYYNNSEKKIYVENSRRYVCLLLLFFLCVSYANAQHDTLQERKYSIDFQIFANTNFNNEIPHQVNFDYNIKRTLLVYQQKLSKKFNFCIAGDTYVKDDGEVYNRTPYLKRAFLQYHNQGIDIMAGLIVLEQFKFQRKVWQLRYVDKTFQCKFNYGDNRNIGVLLKHKLNSRFTYDIAIISGYYTPIEYSSENYKLLAGQTFKTNFCSFRLFNSISVVPYYEQVISLFFTKELKSSKFGIEAAKEFSNNKEIDEDQYGFSVFGNHTFYSNFMCFARYDMNKKAIDSQTESVIWAGVQYSYKKHIDASIYYKNKDFDTNYYSLALFIH